MTDINTGKIILYNSEDGQVKINLHAIDDTVWLSQAEIVELFDSSKSSISEHITNILSDGELDEDSTVRKFRTVALNNKEYLVNYYSLDMILAIGFRVRSPRGVQFRKWSTTILQEYLVKGFTMDDDRLKISDNWDYYDEWLERIRDIRSSEKRFYQKVRDLYATAIDYDKTSDQAKDFFAKVQNKMLWAITGHTAAELIAGRSDPNAPNMGLTSWSGAIVRKGDVGIAKNYLQNDEIDELNRIVTMYLDYAEDQAKRRQSISMEQWSDKLDAFLTFNERELLTGKGSLKNKIAQKLANERYAEFDANRKHTDATQADKADIAEIENIAKQIENIAKQIEEKGEGKL